MSGFVAVSPKRSQTTHFFVEPDQIESDRCHFAREEADHILRTLRLSAGDLIKVTDGLGNLYDVMLGEPGRRGLIGEIVKVSRWLNEPGIDLTVAFGLTLQGKADDIVEQCTQLGVRSFIPLLSANSPVHLDEDKIRTRIERWRKVAISAVKQSLRCYLPTIGAPRDANSLAKTIGDYDLSLVGSFAGKRLIWNEQCSSAKTLLLVTGPEQGLTLDEEAVLESAGAMPITLGERRLRTELAPVVMTTLVLSRADIL